MTLRCEMSSNTALVTTKDRVIQAVGPILSLQGIVVVAPIRLMTSTISS